MVYYRKEVMSTKYEITCPNADEVFIVDEAGLYEIGSQPICYCGMYYEIRQVANA